MTAKGTEFEVLRHDGSFEVRRYEGFLTANVRVSATGYGYATNEGFNPLADYIFGNNHQSSRIAMTVPVSVSHAEGQKIAMTAPVTATRLDEQYIVSFTMPPQYSMDDLPTPNNPMVALESIEPRVVAVVRYSGYFSERGFVKEADSLRQWMAEQGLQPIGEPVSAQYDAPWKPGFVRHNEVLIAVDPESPGLV